MTLCQAYGYILVVKQDSWVTLEQEKYDLLTVLYLPDKRPKLLQPLDGLILHLSSSLILRKLFPKMTKKQRRKLKKYFLSEEELLDQWRDDDLYKEFEEWKKTKKHLRS